MIAAPTRAGKSYFVGACCEDMHDQEIPFVIMDTKTTNHVGLQELKNVKKVTMKPGLKYDWKKLIDYDYILCVPTLRTRTADLIELYREMLDTLWTEPGERIFVIEEAHNWNKNSSVPDPLLEQIAREGAGQKKYLWFVTQRLQNFSQLLWAQCGNTYLFHFNIPSDIRYAGQMIPNFEDLNRELELHDVLTWDGRDYEIIKAERITRRTPHKG
jgi:hypothetical protein